MAAAAGAAGYAWWATGVRPFSTAAVVAVALPVTAVAGAGVWRGRHRGPGPPASWRGTWPWTVLVLAALGLELAGLALGGRSSRFPTLSTVVDHALAWHGTRLVLFGVWLALGGALVRLAARGPARRAP